MADNTEQYDPGAHTVDEVNAYLADADQAELDRVLDAEEAGRNRKGVLEWRTGGPPTPGAAEPEQSDAIGQAGSDTVTAGVFEQFAAEADALAAVAAGEAETAVRTPEEAQKAGYIGVSPAREVDGRSDKGLSQRSILPGK